MITAAGPMLVLTISLVNGIRRIINMIKGVDRKRFTMRETTLYKTSFGASPVGDVANK
jgi:hypothetical protein